MRKITKRSKIKEVSSRWDRQYHKYKGEPRWKEQLDKGDKLRKLDLSKVSAKVVEDIIGNSNWTRNECSECEEDKSVIIRFFERHESEYECNVCDLCKDCIKKAASEFKLIKDKDNK